MLFEQHRAIIKPTRPPGPPHSVRVGFLFCPLTMATYTKPYLTLPDQLQLIKSRGLQVVDDTNAIKCLHRNGYYRLSAYWYPFREIVSGTRTDQFLPGSRFEDAVSLYAFDKNLKLLLLDALERVEIAARAEIALLLGQRDTFAHENPALFSPYFTTPSASGRIPYDEWIQKFQGQVRRSADEFVLHYERQYGARSPLPIWIAIELWDFGMLSHAFSGMDVTDQELVARRFSVPSARLMRSWLRSLNYVRNVIAHHGRLWNANLVDNPAMPRPRQLPDFSHLIPLTASHSRVYSVCCILNHFTRVIYPQSSWVADMKSLVSGFPVTSYASVGDMGFPAGWQNQAIWR